MLIKEVKVKTQTSTSLGRDNVLKNTFIKSPLVGNLANYDSMMCKKSGVCIWPALTEVFGKYENDVSYS